jgi:hypothetical protein
MLEMLKLYGIIGLEMSDYVKNCLKHGDLTIEKVIKQGSKNGIIKYRCKECMAYSHKKHYQNNRQKVRAAHKIYQEKDPERYRQQKNKSTRKIYWNDPKKRYAMQRDWVARNPDKESARKNRHKRKAVKELDDFYVKQILKNGTSLKNSDFPQSMVNLKRAIILLRRHKRKVEAEQNVQNQES